ncbi:MAG: ABC transporter permease subunit [Holophagaceae bacterium]|nr:ABC transporter permease subunit [Holophagaceae bacterium]
MSILAVTRREWTGRRNVLLLALGVGIIQLMGLYFESDPRTTHEKASFMGVFSGTMLAWVIALLFGATMVSRDLEERRFGFLLNQPLHPAQIFLGKVLAGLGLASVAGLLASLPAVLLSGLWRQVALRDVASILGVGLAGSLSLLLLFHAVSIQVRSRSLWLLLDLAAWVVFFGVVRGLSLRLIGAEAFPEMFRLWLVLLVGVTLGLGLAGYLQVAQGRADLQRGHRWVSVTLASTLGVMLLVGAVDVAWVLKHRPPAAKAKPRGSRIR